MTWWIHIHDIRLATQKHARFYEFVITLDLDLG
jgi:hypothetical protein